MIDNMKIYHFKHVDLLLYFNILLSIANQYIKFKGIGLCSLSFRSSPPSTLAVPYILMVRGQKSTFAELPL